MLSPGHDHDATTARSAERALPRRRFLRSLTGVGGMLALDPAALRRAARDLAAQPAPPRAAAVALVDDAPTHLAWVWQFSQDGGKEQIAAALARYGLGVVVKTHDGTDWMAKFDRSADAIDGPRQVAALARFFEDRGVPFHTWTVVEGKDPAREAQLAADVLSAGARSISLDLEAHDGFWRGSAAAAAAYGRALRAQQPNARVVTSIDARPWEVDRIPLAQFAAFSDEIAPQIYWSQFSTAANVTKFAIAGYAPGRDGVTPRFALDVALDKLAPLQLPMVPVGEGASRDAGKWSDFIARAYTHDAPAVSVWRYGVTASSVWQLLAANPPRPATYVVRPDDTLSAIADRFGTNAAALARLNGIANPNVIGVGTVLRVRPGTARPASTPATPSTYTVQPGDTLSGIADRFGIAAGAIAQANGITDPGLLYVGAELRLPGGGGRAAAPAAPSRYSVQPGDSLIAVAERFGVGPQALADANGLSVGDWLRVGQELRIPGGGSPATPATPAMYMVQPGDNLTAIADRFGTDVNALIRLNGLARPDRITVGSVLHLR